MRGRDRQFEWYRTEGIVGTRGDPVNRQSPFKVDEILNCLGWTLISPRCLVCGGEPEPTRRRLDLCRSCLRTLPRCGPSCPRCGAPVPDAQPCGACRRRPPPWDSACIAFTYQEPIDRLLLALKFKGELAAGVLLGRLLARRLRMRQVDVIVPIPLAERRQAERRYNQAHELALQVSRRHGIPIDARALKRIRDTPAQMGLSATARRRNLRGALIADPHRLRGQRIAIVDDVVTTGATMAAAARITRAAGARSIEIWAVARAG
jgi:ComF family protein